MLWQVGSSATLGTNSAFTGSILALTSISVDTGDTIARTRARPNGAVTLSDDTDRVASCASAPPPPTTTPTSTRLCDTHGDADLYDLCDTRADQARADADLYELCDTHADADRHEPAPGAYSHTRPHYLAGDRLGITVQGGTDGTKPSPLPTASPRQQSAERTRGIAASANGRSAWRYAGGRDSFERRI